MIISLIHTEGYNNNKLSISKRAVVWTELYIWENKLNFHPLVPTNISISTLLCTCVGQKQVYTFLERALFSASIQLFLLSPSRFHLGCPGSRERDPTLTLRHTPGSSQSICFYVRSLSSLSSVGHTVPDSRSCSPLLYVQTSTQFLQSVWKERIRHWQRTLG